jgi:hypothetical protein
MNRDYAQLYASMNGVIKTYSTLDQGVHIYFEYM